MARWTDSDLPSLAGRTYVITGATSGLGLETAAALAAHDARVVLTGRDPGRLDRALAVARGSATGPDPVAVPLDLADLASIRDAAARIGEEIGEIDVLVNNAGVMAPPRGETKDGFELQIGTNHLGHFALTGLLLPLLPTGDPARDARVITLASGAHRMGSCDPSDLNYEHRTYRPWQAYGQSKLANLLFTRELDRRARESGAALTAAAAHPGYAGTNLQFAGPAYAQNPVGRLLTKGMNTVLGQSARAGSWPTLYAATQPDVRGGDYIGPDGWFEMRGHPRKVDPNSAACDDTNARALWEASEELTGVEYPWPVAAGR